MESHGNVECDAIWDRVVDELCSRPLWSEVEERARFERLDGSFEVERSPGSPLLRGLRERRGPRPDDDLAPWERLGYRRAQAGVALDDIMQGWRIYHEALRAHARSTVPDSPEGAAVLLQVLDVLAAWVDVGMITSARSHRRGEAVRGDQFEERKAAVVRALLHGDPHASELPAAQEIYRLDLRAGFHAVRVRLTASVPAAEVERCLLPGGQAAWSNGLLAVIDGDLCGLVAKLPGEVTVPAVIGISCPVSIDELPSAFVRATRALETALAMNLVGIHDLESLGLNPAILADTAIGDLVLRRYITPLLDRGDVGRDVLRTVWRYLDHGGRIEATATELHLHPNTVRYRLGRFEQLTHCSLRGCDARFEAWWGLRRAQLVGLLPADL